MTVTRRPGTASVVPTGPRLAARAKAQRRARRLRIGAWITKGLVAAVPVLAIAWALLLSGWLAVDKVEVVGVGRLPVEQVLAAVDVDQGTPLARIDAGAVADRVRALPPVADVEVLRSWPDTLRIVVTERVAAAAVERAGAVELVDAEGVLFATEPALPPNLVRLQVAEPGPEDPATRAALQVYAELPEPLRGLVSVVRAESPTSVVLLLADARQVVWGPPGDTATKAAATEALLRMEGTVFDVSAPGVVVRR